MQILWLYNKVNHQKINNDFLIFKILLFNLNLLYLTYCYLIPYTTKYYIKDPWYTIRIGFRFHIPIFLNHLIVYSNTLQKAHMSHNLLSYKISSRPPLCKCKIRTKNTFYLFYIVTQIQKNHGCRGASRTSSNKILVTNLETCRKIIISCLFLKIWFLF